MALLTSVDQQPSETARASGAAIGALLFNAFVWGVSWWPFRYLESRGLSSLWTTAFIYLSGTVLLACWFWFRRTGAARALHNDPKLFSSARGSLIALLVLAIAAGLTNVCFNWSVTTGSVVRVVLLFYLMPIWAVLLARWLLDEPITSSAVARILLALAGAVAILWRPELGWPWPESLPDWLAIAGGAAFALTNVMLRRLQTSAPLSRALSMFIGSGVLSLLLAVSLTQVGLTLWPGGAAQASLLPGWLPGVLLMAAVFLCSNLALQFGAARLPANVTAVVMLSEVLFASVSAILLGKESLTMALGVGGALILLAAWLASVERPLPRGPAAAS